MKKPLIFAHRGAKGSHPENTMIAFKEAERIGADGIELDIHLSKDGELVVIHDETVDRTTNGVGLVSEQTVAELQSLDAGSHKHPSFHEAKIPTLREVLIWLSTTKLQLNIELKTDVIHYPNIERKVVDLVREYHLSNKIIFSSFHHDSISLLAEIAPEIPRALLYDEPMLDPVGEARKREATGLHPNFKLLTKEFVQMAQKQGFIFRPYTINEEQDLQTMIDYGVDVIITDWPTRALELLS
ncbi:glycerophosphodiester phosphodiesterase [Bacillus cytotoxicus]|uniref:Glycerophosphodiester phosphodiesterase n=1 Tax=Bacillus cytotoxicus (strain DSM 22905 / CIP 110041 / 391-98 / NVH 391-98) TaxID=315749 RepID=A7GVB5_BACCN|nr:glycerophosphodiester phosphodiesterase [Bacillus cytotoxicus]ABS24073.1 Glycerophosphodiester phosphodiesterase [Bacillus cytotoxicus NVH 391-98]AWC34704.1 glycerophosphodiester phosphodiesterase [Bacillus cytotoxicus]AWC38696.1 glycerophosphodiester phosphodiesterase [Bacillus cytotoxicus]AWC46673.1 glycerophosphodiester phosphodiesterase [Bacillus cytotoxicus]AWC62915.1 glycerophosphodiester phosphodiesterase [Bacillus cytotoxicus]